MKYLSTKDHNLSYPLAIAARQSLASDGSLFMPETIPNVYMGRIMELAQKGFSEVASYLASLYFHEEIPLHIIRKICKEAYNFEVPLHKFDKNISTLELFHGPTLAFKDFGARFMSRMLTQLFPKDRIRILTATSGDTGSAVAAGFYGMPNIDVYILYPKGRVSDFQERQMSCMGGNITAIQVNGSFDDCQSMVKAVFNDTDFSISNNITSANSISLLRWIPQSFYYFWAYAQWKLAGGVGNPTIVVSSGNFGNITAGMLAYKMGLPVDKFIAVTNSNDVVPVFLETGIFEPKESIHTISNAMDVGNPSNYERMIDLVGGDKDFLRDILSGVSYNDEVTADTIREVYDKYNYIIDPHSALGYRALEDSKRSGFFISTAHQSKFKEIIEPILGVDIPDHPLVGKLSKLDKHTIDMDVDVEALKALLM